MALVKFGGGIIQLSGSLAGNTFARNHYGNYVRAKTKPVNPNTALQIAVRTAVGAMTTRWSQTLTAVQRTAWNLYAASVAMKNKLGEVVYMTGFNHYIRSNSIRSTQGLTIVDDGPTIFELPEKDSAFAITASETTQVITAVFDDTLPWLDENDAHIVIYQGRPQNPQRNFFAGPWRYASKEDGDSVTPPTTPASVAVSFAIAELQKLWCYARILRADGRITEPFSASCFCAA